MNEYINAWRNRIERRYLIIFTIFSMFMFASIFANDHMWVGVFPTFVGVVVCWTLFLGNYLSYDVRSYVLYAFTLADYLIYGGASDNLYAALLPYALIVMLVEILEIRGLSHGVTLVFSIILTYHIFIKKTVHIGDRLDLFEIFLSVLIAVACEMLTYWKLQSDAERMNELEKTIDMLKKTEQSKDAFLANVSHEIRTPLNTICGMSELLMAENFEGKVFDEIFFIRAAGIRLQGLISDVIDISELQSGKIKPVETVYNFSSIINDVINMAMAQNEEKKLELIIDCDPRIPSGLLGDADKIKRIMFCLIDNAIKFTDSGYIYIQVKFRYEGEGINLIINVEDTGVGMSPEAVEKIFDSYNQADVLAKRNRDGMGLGLSIARKFVDIMGGFMHVESSEGNGSRFIVMIPQKVVDNTAMTSIKGSENMQIAIYIDNEKYASTGALPRYISTYINIAKGFELKVRRCQSIAELKYGLGKGKYTHVLLSGQEYKKDEKYFDEISKSVPIILIMEQNDQTTVGANCHTIYKPFSVFNIAAALNGERVMGRRMPEGDKTRERFTAPNAKILAVDDNTMNLRVLEGLLKGYKIHLYKALSGMEALEMIKDEQYDLVFMDHMMPEMDGIETFHEIRKMKGKYYQDVPVVALTANAVNGAREMFLREGFQEYVTKPIDVTQLERVLITFLPENHIEYCNDETSEEKEITAQAEEEIPKKVHSDDILQETVGLEYCGGMEEMYVEFLGYYIEDSKQTVMELENCLKNNDWDGYKTKVHALKSTSLQIGAVSLSELSKKSEMACKEENYEFVKNSHSSIIELYKEVIEAIETKLNKGSGDLV